MRLTRKRKARSPIHSPVRSIRDEQPLPKQTRRSKRKLGNNSQELNSSQCSAHENGNESPLEEEVIVGSTKSLIEI